MSSLNELREIIDELPQRIVDMAMLEKPDVPSEEIADAPGMTAGEMSADAGNFGNAIKLQVEQAEREAPPSFPQESPILPDQPAQLNEPALSEHSYKDLLDLIRLQFPSRQDQLQGPPEEGFERLYNLNELQEGSSELDNYRERHPEYDHESEWVRPDIDELQGSSWQNDTPPIRREIEEDWASRAFDPSADEELGNLEVDREEEADAHEPVGDGTIELLQRIAEGIEELVEQTRDRGGMEGSFGHGNPSLPSHQSVGWDSFEAPSSNESSSSPSIGSGGGTASWQNDPPPVRRQRSDEEDDD